MDVRVRPSDFGQTITNREGHDLHRAIRDPKYFAALAAGRSGLSPAS